MNASITILLIFLILALLVSALPLLAAVVASCMLSSRISQERGE